MIVLEGFCTVGATVSSRKSSGFADTLTDEYLEEKERGGICTRRRSGNLFEASSFLSERLSGTRRWTEFSCCTGHDSLP